MNLEEVKKKFKENHQSDGLANPSYDHVIEEIYNLTDKASSGER